jgi:hypothetical protein
MRVNNNQQIAYTTARKFTEPEGIVATETLISFHTYSLQDLEHMFSIGE